MQMLKLSVTSPISDLAGILLVNYIQERGNRALIYRLPLGTSLSSS